jgi:hypothetical protein
VRRIRKAGAAGTSGFRRRPRLGPVCRPLLGKRTGLSNVGDKVEDEVSRPHGAGEMFKPAAALLLLAIAGLTLSGCVSKARARAQTQAAFLAGQRQAAVERGPGQAQGPFVTIYGSVRQPQLPWQPGLTLAKALVASGYYGREPREIFVVRNGQAKRVDPQVLLSGSDVPLQPGDVVQVNQGP